MNKTLKEVRKPDIQISEGWEWQAEDIARTKSLRWENAWLVGRKGICVSGRDSSKGREEEGGERSSRVVGSYGAFRLSAVGR